MWRRSSFFLTQKNQTLLPFALRMALGIEQLWEHIFAEKLCTLCHAPFRPSDTQQVFALQKFLCAPCLLAVQPQKNPYCHLCGHALPQDFCSKTPCLRCQKLPPPWDTLHYYAPYTSLIKQLILQYKYSHAVSLAPILVSFLHETALSLPPSDICIPMPRHEKRLASQGCNPMLELAKLFCSNLALPLERKALCRTRYTVPQVSLPKAQRQKNPRNSFVAQHVWGKRVLLLDDVITTGATVHHASLALRKAGARSISVLLLARAEK